MAKSETETYTADFDLMTTIERLQAKAIDNLHVEIGRTGHTTFQFEMRNDKHTLSGVIEETDKGSVFVRVQGQHKRNRQLAATLIPISLGITAMIAVDSGLYVLLLVVPVVLVVGTGIVDRLTRSQQALMYHLQDCLKEEKPAKPRRRRMVKRQWGKRS